MKKPEHSNTFFMFAVATIILMALIASAWATTRVSIYSGLGDVPAIAVQDLAAHIRAHCPEATVATYSHLVAPAHATERGGTRDVIVLVGYSMGGNAARDLAAAMYPRRVALLITLDPNKMIGAVPVNVTRAVNFYQNVEVFGGGQPVGAQEILIQGQGHFGFPSNPHVRRRVVGLICALHVEN